MQVSAERSIVVLNRMVQVDPTDWLHQLNPVPVFRNYDMFRYHGKNHLFFTQDVHDKENDRYVSATTIIEYDVGEVEKPQETFIQRQAYLQKNKWRLERDRKNFIGFLCVLIPTVSSVILGVMFLLIFLL